MSIIIAIKIVIKAKYFQAIFPLERSDYLKRVNGIAPRRDVVMIKGTNKYYSSIINL